jgi:hypothetical protein
MKTNLITIGLIVEMLASGQNVHATTPSQRFEPTATFTHRHSAVEAPQPPLELRPEVTGVIPRAIRGRHPLQMLNAFAPTKYGTANQNVVLDPDVPGKADGIKLFSFAF